MLEPLHLRRVQQPRARLLTGRRAGPQAQHWQPPLRRYVSCDGGSGSGSGSGGVVAHLTILIYEE